jgi:hypothetical protein
MVLVNDELKKMELSNRWERRDLKYFNQIALLARKNFLSLMQEIKREVGFQQIFIGK